MNGDTEYHDHKRLIDDINPLVPEDLRIILRQLFTKPIVLEWTQNHPKQHG